MNLRKRVEVDEFEFPSVWEIDNYYNPLFFEEKRT